MSPSTALYPCSWLPLSPLPLFPSLWPLKTCEWRPLDPFYNKPWVTPLNRWMEFENNVKNCEILPVWGAQPSFGQWIMALAKMFSLKYLLTSLEEWKLLPAKTGSFSASSSSVACLTPRWSYSVHLLYFFVHLLLSHFPIPIIGHMILIWALPMYEA